MLKRGTRVAKFLLLLILIVIVFTTLSHVIKVTEEPDFCASCHLMEQNYYSWSKSVHRSLKCVECHLPHENILDYYYWKIYLGLNDYIKFYLFREENISLKREEFVKENCLRCHGEILMSEIERNCWKCHKVAHDPGVML